MERYELLATCGKGSSGQIDAEARRWEVIGNDVHVVEGAGEVVAGRKNVDAIVSTNLNHAEGTSAQLLNSRQQHKYTC